MSLKSLSYELCIEVNELEIRPGNMSSDVWCLGKISKWESNQPELVGIRHLRMQQTTHPIPIPQWRMGTLEAVVTSQLGSLPDSKSFCDDFDIEKDQEDWLSRLEVSQKLWWKYWEVEQHALKYVKLLNCKCFGSRIYASLN